MQWKFEVFGAIEADVSVPAGLIEVKPAGGGDVVVELEAMRGGRRAEELLEASEVSLTDGRLRVEVPAQRFRNVEVRCTLSLPERSALHTRTASSDVRCPVALDRFDGQTASGDILLGDVESEVSVKAASGDLHCDQVGGALKVRTASGDVAVRRTGGAVDINLASGDVEIDEAGASVRVKTASGDVRIVRASEGRVQVTSASGDVVIGIAPGVGAYLDVTSVTGDTTTTLPFAESGGTGAALEIVCRTVSGDVSIRKAAS